MSINKLMVIIVIVFLFYSNIFVLNSVYNIRQEKDILYNELQNNHINNCDAIAMLSRQANAINQYNSFKQYLVSKDVVSKDFIFVYRYTNSVCQSCINRDLNILKSFANKYGIDRVIVVSSVADNRENRIKLDVDLKGIRYFIVPDSAWEISVDKNTNTAFPFFALINNKLDIEFIVFSDMTDLVNSFVDNFELYFNHFDL